MVSPGAIFILGYVIVTTDPVLLIVVGTKGVNPPEKVRLGAEV